ncbi:hypothetical protein [Sulfitobacter sp.]|jgi:hypothetical protein|uniref:hypothetical protein n=1 Tax=Sulfitobacter sp. TaxID=1903071 RepID=UPI003EF1C40E
MRFLAAVVTCTALLSACGGPSVSPEQKARLAKFETDLAAAEKVAPTIKVGPNTYRVSRVDGQEYAFVKAIGTTAPYYVPDIERAGTQIYGCKTKFNPGILGYMTGDINKLDLNMVKSKANGKSHGWNIKVSC